VWSTPQEFLFNNDIDIDGGVRAMRVNFTAMVRVGSNSPSAPEASFFFETIVFLENATIPFGPAANNDNVTVNVGALKFNFDIEDWPFASTANSLLFSVDIQVTSNPQQAPTECTSVCVCCV